MMSKGSNHLIYRNNFMPYQICCQYRKIVPHCGKNHIWRSGGGKWFTTIDDTLRNYWVSGHCNHLRCAFDITKENDSLISAGCWRYMYYNNFVLQSDCKGSCLIMFASPPPRLEHPPATRSEMGAKVSWIYFRVRGH